MPVREHFGPSKKRAPGYQNGAINFFTNPSNLYFLTGQEGELTEMLWG